MMKLTRIGLVAVALALAAAFAGVGRPETAATATGSARSITVTGSGLASGVPNRASFVFGVQTQAKSAAAALAANATEIRKVIAAIKGAGVATADIQTTGIDLSPRYSNDGQDIVGYTATNSVSATIKDINRAGSLIDAAVSAGANQVSGPTFTRSDRTRLYRLALRAAIADARSKAATIAKASGVRLGGIRAVVESSSAPPVPYAKAGGVADASTPVQPGTQTIQADVSVEFAIA
jgi:uncharacterized protein YggE